MKFKDAVRITDRGVARLRTKLGKAIIGRNWDEGGVKSVVEIKGWVQTVLRERGKIVPGSRREGFNIWTKTGSEYLALRTSIDPTDLSVGPYRRDMIGYLGVGTGAQTEDTNVLRLVTPAAYVSGQFLAPLEAVGFPLTPTRTTAEYRRVFAENEITTSPSTQVNISEFGLFTNGDPSSSRAEDPRVTTLVDAANQQPLAYKTIEPVGKTDQLELEVIWQIRY